MYIMINNIENKIHTRINALKDILEYNSKAINEAIAILNELDYLLYLKDSLSKDEKTDS